MEQSDIKRLIHDYGPVKWVNKSVFGFRNEGWFVIDTIPLPPEDEVEKVILDIINDREIAYADGKVRHWHENASTHYGKDNLVTEVITSLKDNHFRIGVCSGNDDRFLEGQPIAISLMPTITYMDFPDHPHLNTGGYNGSVFIPDSFCYGYTVEPERYGTNEYEKYIRVFDETTLSLLRHQIWVAIRNRTGKGHWIGKHDTNGLPPLVYANVLNPLAKCRCGKQKRYLECHLPLDLSEVVNKRAKSEQKKRIEIQHELIKQLLYTWKQRMYNPQKEMLNKLNRMLR